MYNDHVTDVAAWQEALADVAERTRCVVSAPAAQEPKGSLEDVEKLVRRHDIEIDALVEAVAELMEFTRFVPGAVYAPGLD